MNIEALEQLTRLRPIIEELRAEYKTLEGRVDCDEELSKIADRCLIHNLTFDMIIASEEEYSEIVQTVFFSRFSL